MPIDAIGDLNLRIAETEAQGIEKRAGMKQEREQALATGIGESIKGGLASAEVLQKQAIDTQMKKEANEILKSGVNGVKAYATELGVDPTLYVNMANMAKSPEELKPIYQLMKKKSDKDAVTKSVNDTMMELKPIFNEAMTTSNPDTIAKVRNKAALVALNAPTPEAREEAARMVKMLDDASVKASKAGGLGEKDIIDTEDKLRGEIDKTTKDAKQSIQFAQRAITLGQAALNNPKGLNTSSDIALIMSFNKLLDPGSVVREGEYARNEQAQGVFNWMAGFIQSMKATGGAKLTDTARRNIMKSMQSMQKLYKLNILEEKSGRALIAMRRGGDARSVIPNITQEELSILQEANDKKQLLSQNEAYNKKRTAIIEEAMAAADAAAKESQKDEAKFMYKGPNMLKDFIKDNGLDDTYLSPSTLGGVSLEEGGGEELNVSNVGAVEKKPEVVAEKTRTKEELKASIASKNARLAELKAKQGAK